MTSKKLLAVVGLAAFVGSIAVAQPAKEVKPNQPAKAAQPEKTIKIQQPAVNTKPEAAQPGKDMPKMTEQQAKDMQACMEAAQPGEQHAILAKKIGTWTGKTKMWMTPEAPPMESPCTQVVTSAMEGRFIRCEITGDMGEMGQFLGFGLTGFDNVSKKFVSTWVDNWGSGIMNGTGEMSSDGKVLTWSFDYNCPIAKKPAVMREVQTDTGPDSYTLEMFGKDPHTGKESKMMEIQFTRKPTPAAKAQN